MGEEPQNDQLKNDSVNTTGDPTSGASAPLVPDEPDNEAHAASAANADNPPVTQFPTPPDMPPKPAEEEPAEQPEIDSFTTVEVAGIKFVIGLGLDSRVYNWNVNKGQWQLFVINKSDQGASESPILG